VCWKVINIPCLPVLGKIAPHILTLTHTRKLLSHCPHLCCKLQECRSVGQEVFEAGDAAKGGDETKPSRDDEGEVGADPMLAGRLPVTQLMCSCRCIQGQEPYTLICQV
jgi:hypothetical protein